MAARFTLTLTFSLLLANSANASDMVNGRFGRTEIRYTAEQPAVFHQGQKIIALPEALNATILRVIPETTQDFILVEARISGLHCIHSYRLLSVPATGPVQASRAMNSCGELAGVSFAGPHPVVHFQAGPGKVEHLLWKDGKLNELPASSRACFGKHEQAVEKGSRTAADGAGHLVAGEGRLQFHSAPDERCALAGTFIVPGDLLATSRTFGRYTLAFYQNPKTAKVAAGWVESERLKPAR